MAEGGWGGGQTRLLQRGHASPGRQPGEGEGSQATATAALTFSAGSGLPGGGASGRAGTSIPGGRRRHWARRPDPPGASPGAGDRGQTSRRAATPSKWLRRRCRRSPWPGKAAREPAPAPPPSTAGPRAALRPATPAASTPAAPRSAPQVRGSRARHYRHLPPRQDLDRSRGALQPPIPEPHLSRHRAAARTPPPLRHPQLRPSRAAAPAAPPPPPAPVHACARPGQPAAHAPAAAQAAPGPPAARAPRAGRGRGAAPSFPLAGPGRGGAGARAESPERDRARALSHRETATGPRRGWLLREGGARRRRQGRGRRCGTQRAGAGGG